MTSIELKPGDRFFLRNEKYIDDLEFVVLYQENQFYNIFSKGIYPYIYCLCISNTFGKQPYHTTHTPVSWRHSYLRNYLNDKEVVNRICSQDNLLEIGGYGSGPGDVVSLLSYKEAERYKDILCSIGIDICTWLMDKPSTYHGGARAVVYEFHHEYSGFQTIKECDVLTTLPIHPVINLKTEKLKLKTEDGKIIYY